jgi:hypothetical protein
MVKNEAHWIIPFFNKSRVSPIGINLCPYKLLKDFIEPSPKDPRFQKAIVEIM